MTYLIILLIFLFNEWLTTCAAEFLTTGLKLINKLKQPLLMMLVLIEGLSATWHEVDS